MTDHNEKNYYMNLKPKLMKDFKNVEDYMKNVLVQYFDQSKIEQVLRETGSEFEILLPTLPYVGGEANVLTDSLIMCAWYLPFFRALEGEGLSLREIAKIAYEKMEHDVESKSVEKKRKVREFYFSPSMQTVEINRSKETKSGKYPGDWVSEYVEGDGKIFDFGIDFTECAVCKFLEPHDALRYVPIFCLGDYATYRAFGIGFKRTQTIANGASWCDFRFKKDWETPRGWPTEELEEKFSFSDA